MERGGRRPETLAEPRLGKRSRPPMRRRPSLAEFSAADQAAVTAIDEVKSSRLKQHRHRHKERLGLQQQSFNVSVDFAETESAQFLMICSLCNRRLGPGIDTFIYRGEFAFCSQECREKKIIHLAIKEKHLALKEKHLLMPMKSNASPSTAPSEASSNGETVAVA